MNSEGVVDTYIIAVAGNPNVGKSTLFNLLTGSRQRVGNWPGKTIERKEGERIIDNVRLKFIDLPGTYSLSALSLEEIIARRFIVEAKPNVVVNIVDASNLERNLYLTLQILELTNNVVIALNMMDLATKKGIKIDVKKLSEILGVPVIPMVAIKGTGVEELIEAVLKVSKGEIACRSVKIDYGREIEAAIAEIIGMLVKSGVADELPYPLRWIALRLLEGDREIVKAIREINGDLIAKIEELKRNLSDALGDDVDVIIADKRYIFIEEIVKVAVEKSKVAELTITDKLDRIVLNRFLGLPILVGVFALSFIIVFSVNIGFPLNLLIPEIGEYNLASLISDYIFGYISEVASSYLISIGAPSWFVSLVSDGIIAGVGAVLSFYPLILTVFILFGLLEDCGYMARAAFIMDRVMRKFGLNGRAFMPLMLGYGCNIPSVTATRILHRWRDRLLSILLCSLIPCQARLAAFIIIVAATFGSFTAQVLVMLSLYVLSLVLLVFVGSLFNKVLFKEEPSSLIMELPPYHRPSLRVVLWHAEERSKHFILKAGTVILLVSVFMWILISWGPAGPAST
ncbi:MAG: ferrous iron transport protein B, partial [Candidatus Methanomethylicota archaeon]